VSNVGAGTAYGHVPRKMPAVSVIIPCYNEEATICLLLEAIHNQTFPRAQMEVVVADGLSTDRTRQEIEKFRLTHPELFVRVVDNLRRTIPSGLNQAIQAAQGEFIVRLDAHSVPAADYVERSEAALRAGHGDNVGGVWQIHPQGSDWMARSIAIAAAHPLGAGDARYRVGGKAQAVDTVPFGAYRKSLVERLGLYDETLLSNEDYEFNVRVRRSGGVIWLDPEIRSQYFARPDLPSLARQYFRYGYWKARMLRRYPGTIRWRQMLPPVFVLSIIVLGLLGLFYSPFLWLLAAEAGGYGLVLLLAGAQAAYKHKFFPLLLGVPLAMITMHLSWGGAFLWSLIFHVFA
jgi:succinoglycan biosynthesis protein ExoA